MKRLLLALVLSLTVVASAQERIDLTAPETKPNTTSYSLSALHLDWDNGTILVFLKGANGEVFVKAYTPTTTPTGVSLIISLNKANLSVTSLQKRIYQQLIADGVKVGTISGTPQ
jgi:hypothetical protein